MRSVIHDANVILAPMADGGEGTSSLFAGERITLPTTDAAGRLTEATYTFDAETETAYIDVAAATGLPAVKDHLVPLTGDTYGTGVLVADAETAARAASFSASAAPPPSMAAPASSSRSASTRLIPAASPSPQVAARWWTSPTSTPRR